MLVPAHNCCQCQTTTLSEAEVALMFNLSVFNGLKAPHTVYPAGVMLLVSDSTSDCCLMSVFPHVAPIFISCDTCIIAPHSCACVWVTYMVILVWKRPCSPVVFSVRCHCLDKQRETEKCHIIGLSQHETHLTVTLIATLQEQQGDMITGFWMFCVYYY